MLQIRMAWETNFRQTSYAVGKRGNYSHYTGAITEGL